MAEPFSFTPGFLLRFATGRGATALAVGLTAYALDVGRATNLFPVIGLAVGVPITATLATMDHNTVERHLRNRYRGEIAAVLGIAPQEVTIDHLRLVAEGKESLNLPGNLALHESLLRNDRHRTISMVANILAAAATIGGVLIAGPLLGVQAGLPLLFGASLTSFGLDVAMKHLGNALFGYESPAVDEQISAIGQGLRRGRQVTPEQVMSLVATANPRIGRDVEQRYGAAFERLPNDIRKDVVAQYEPAFELKATSEALNLGILPVTELAFTIEGVRSGAYPPVSELIDRFHQSVMSRSEDQAVHHWQVPGYERARSFVDRVRPAQLPQEAQSFAERVSQPSYPEVSKSIH